MPIHDASYQHRLIGENAPTWLALGLLLIGAVGSVTTAWLMLPPGVTVETLKSWALQSDSKDTVSSLPPSGTGTVAVPMAMPPADKLAEHTDTFIDDKNIDGPKSVQGNGRENLEASSPTASLDQAKKPVATISEDEIVEKSEPSSGVLPVIEGELRLVEQKEVADRESLPQPPGTATQTESADTDDETPISVTKTETQPPSAEAPDCPSLFTVTFGHGGLDPLDSNLHERFARLREWLSIHPKATVLIEGHADASGPEEFNLLVSYRRAKIVADLLTEAGIAENRLTTRAFGEYSPLAGHLDESNQNRRVDLRVQSAGTCPKSLNDGDLR